MTRPYQRPATKRTDQVVAAVAFRHRASLPVVAAAATAAAALAAALRLHALLLPPQLGACDMQKRAGRVRGLRMPEPEPEGQGAQGSSRFPLAIVGSFVPGNRVGNTHISKAK